MWVILTAFVAAAGLGVAAGVVLSTHQRTAYEAFATAGARVDDPGVNLVGSQWTGMNDDKREQKS
jgi:hypothetical protein